MKNVILLFLSLFTTFAQAQLNTMQDRPSLKWMEIESPNFKVVYPDHLSEKAQYVLNLLEHYRDSGSATYGIDTRKYTVIIRSELASPNGFVTLMPRRSEWFSASAISPIVSSLEWYQSLAVHEYRHMVQFDFIKNSNVNWGYWLFGDLGGAALMGLSAPPWYFEGDAVWTETVHSNAGRGRAPRFSARMKSLMINDEIPTYDEFIGGVYTSVIPNHYVYGYYLITRAYNKYGPDVWKRIIGNATDKPYNPYTFYNGFKRATGEEFEHFYEDSMKELQKEWSSARKTEKQASNDLYTRYEYPIVDGKDLYFLKWDLDNFWALYKSDGKKAKKLKDLNIYPTLSKVDLKRGKFAYPQMMPHYRYGYRDFSDLYLLDLNTGDQSRITDGLRAYHPQIHPSKDLIMAVEFVDSKKYGLSFFDFNGEKTNSILLDKYDVAEAVWLSADKALVLILDERGMKFIATIDTKTKDLSILKAAGRNTVYSFQASGNKAYFEGDDRGVVNVFELDLKTNKLSICTQETTAAYRPYPTNGKLVYVAEVDNGQQIKIAKRKCVATKANFLTDYNQYLGKTPSDSFAKSKPVEVDNFSKLYESKWSSGDFSELEEGFTPNTWSFIGGRGFELYGQTTNFLNTFSLYGTYGEDAIEHRPFADLTLSYRKYFPIFNLGLAYQERNNDDDEWSEARIGLDMLLPYQYRFNLYNGFNALLLGTQNIEISDRDFAAPYKIDDEQVLQSTVGFSSSLLKDRRFRELQASWGYELDLQYINAKAEQVDSFSSYLGYGRLDLYTPGLAANHGLNLSLSSEYRKPEEFTYRIDSPANRVNEYAFSRGYSYEYVDRWEKAAFNYVLPLAYPNKAFGRWIYFNRIFANLFVDHTKVMDAKDISLNSAGAEFFFESLTLRKLPLTYGLRYINKLSDEENVAEMFLLVNIAI